MHNEKSLKPLGQINFVDRQSQIYVHVQNNGIGPLVVEQLTFIKDGQPYSSIKDCLDIDPKSYMSIDVSVSSKKVVLAGTYLEIFSIQFEDHEGKSEQDNVRQELSRLSLKAYCKDIYENKIVIERDFKWFIRNLTPKI